ncbi:MAG: hypothetical protein GY834_07585 [Bacteroidetes bacterium]|jgi:hypothetical protein|nr:hypothetical protein [Bacteroidota bacterium]
MTTFETLTEDQRSAILEAKNLVTIEDLSALSYGEDLELTNKVCLSHYCEDDIIVLNLSEEWEEVFQILFNTDTEEIIFESI